MTSRDLRWPEVTHKWCYLTGSHLEVAVERQKLIHFTFYFLQGGRLHEEAVKWQEMTSRDLRIPEVTLKWRHLTGSHLEVAVEGWKLTNTVHFTSYKDVARRRRQCRDRKWHHVTSGDWKWQWSDVILQEVTWKWLQKAKNSHILYISLPTRRSLAGAGSHVTGNDVTWPQVTRRNSEVTSFDRKSPGSCCRRQKLSYTVYFHFEKAVARRRRQARGRKWCHVTLGDRKWCKLTASHLEVAVDGQTLAYALHFTSYKAVARTRKQSSNSKWRQWPQATGSDTQVMSFDRKSPGSGCGRPKTRVHCTFHFPQCGSLQEEAVTWQEKMSRDSGDR